MGGIEQFLGRYTAHGALDSVTLENEVLEPVLTWPGGCKRQASLGGLPQLEVGQLVGGVQGIG